MWRFAIPVVLFAVLAVFLFRGLSLNPGYIPSPLVGRPAPEFSLPDLQDPTKQVGSRDFAGRVAILNVWATWCPPCRQEHPFLVELSRTSGVPIFGLNWNDDRDAALEWLETLGNPYVATAYDPQGDVAVDWGVYGAPETFLIGPDGTVLHKHTSALTPEIWRRDFVPKIAEACGGSPCPSAGGE
ncbi:MAG TPA: DsbE family thiol:disulfide interchange protein [Gammaproteobacteria bacterium]